MVTFLILMRIGKVEGALEFVEKSKNLITEIYKQEMSAEGASQGWPAYAGRQNPLPGVAEEGPNASRLSQWQDAAVEALLCSDSDVEVVDDDQDGSKLR